MFTVVVDRRKRRVWSARTVAISIGAHLLVLAGVVAAATNTQAAPTPPKVVDIWTASDKPKDPEPVKPTPPQPRVQVKGDFVAVPTPEAVPESLPPVDSTETPLSGDDVTGIGDEGDMIAPHGDSTSQPTTGNTDPPLPDFRDGVIDAESADVLPQLVSPREAQRALERAYPSMLRDAGVTGHTTVLLVIDKNGQVQPGSITVQETTHDQFREAAVRAAERFRFRPARLNGQPVTVSISLPIEWQIAP